MPRSKENESQRKDRDNAIYAIRVAGGIGVASLVFFAVQPPRNLFFSRISVGLITAGAALLVGGVLGFLFGIPRTLQQDKEPAKTDSAGKNESVGYRPNTNLEQISDWLTKILVGVGLTQLHSLKELIGNLGKEVGKGFGGGDTDASFAAAIIVYWLVCGFLLGYLWTRLYLAGALRKADVVSLAERVEQLDDFVRQADADAKALAITMRQLKPTPDAPQVPQSELNAALKSASPMVSIQVFYQAQDVRTRNWRLPSTKPIMERTIPIFRALVNSDPDERFHQNHGQLGYALKDQRKPDWKIAEVELTKAIEIRGDWKEHGWLIYELNRAIARIMQDQQFAEGKPSASPDKDAVFADLRAVWTDEYLRNLLQGEAVVGRWLQINDMSLDPNFPASSALASAT